MGVVFNYLRNILHVGVLLPLRWPTALAASVLLDYLVGPPALRDYE